MAAMRQDLIFDVGMHRGEDTVFYLLKGFHVVAVEVHPDLASEVAQRLANYVNSGQLIIVNKAIAADEGEVRFYANQHESIWGTIDPTFSERNRRKGAQTYEIIVPSIRFITLIKTYGVPYFLKVDIEGADRLCLDGLLESDLSSDSLPKYLSIESSKSSFGDVQQELATLQRLGYRKFKIVPQRRVASQILPNPALEGNYVTHRFEEGSSGAFGQEAPGRWMDAEAALRTYRWIFYWYRLAGDDAAFTRIGRRLLRAHGAAKIPVTATPVTASSAPERLTPVEKFVRTLSSGLRPGWYDTHAMR
ncbi:MAG: FkbM family methyltransferase [Rhodopila sp.]